MHNTARRQITWKPGRGLSPEAYHSDILILDFLASRLRETNSYLSHTVYGILLQRPELRQSDDYWLRAHSGGSLPEFQSWFFCLLAFFFFLFVCFLAHVLFILVCEKSWSTNQWCFLQRRFMLPFTRARENSRSGTIWTPFFYLIQDSDTLCLLLVWNRLTNICTCPQEKSFPSILSA